MVTPGQGSMVPDESLFPPVGVDGERDLTEQVLGHLSGNEGARPVRAGNAAYKQPQHDVWGTVLQSIGMDGGGMDGG